MSNDLVRKEMHQTFKVMEPQIKAALPAHVPVAKFTRVALTAINDNADLLNADRNSLFASCLKAAQFGLMPDGKESAFVIFNKNVGSRDNPNWVKAVQFMPMIAGVLKLVRNSGELATLSSHLVKSNDEFDFWIDETGEHFRHVPKPGGDIVSVYAMAKTKDGGIYFEIMDKEEIDQVRNSSKSKSSGPWVSWYSEMAKKTVIRRLSKRLPMSTDLEGALSAEDDFETISSEARNVNQEVRASDETTQLLENAKEIFTSRVSEEEIPT